jgi:cyanophycinase
MLAMPIVCLQGGNELTPDCRAMDELLLDRSAAGPVVVVPLASKPGVDYERTSANAVHYFTSLGADVVAAPDARKDREGAVAAVASAGLIVLTGGSPRTLRDALADTGLGSEVRTRLAHGVPVMGSSAGAMVACQTTLLPQWRGTPNVGPGLGLVPGYVVVPHFDGRRSAWVNAALPVADRGVLGIPECSGVLADLDERGTVVRLTAVGVAASTLVTPTERTELVAGVGFEPT